MQFFNVEKLFDFVLICLFSWNCSAVLCYVAVKRAFLSGLRQNLFDIILTHVNWWHCGETGEWRRMKKNKIDWSTELDEASTRHIECVFCLLSLFLKSQYWSKDYWLGWVLTVLCFFYFSLHFQLHGLTHTIRHMLVWRNLYPRKYIEIETCHRLNPKIPQQCSSPPPAFKLNSQT